MEEYNFWQDFFDTYQSLSDWMKFAWLIILPTFLLALVALGMRYRIASKRAENETTGDLAYTIYRNTQGHLQIHRHGELTNQEPELLLLEQGADRVPLVQMRK